MIWAQMVPYLIVAMAGRVAASVAYEGFKPMYPDWELAVHESAHAIVAHLLGFRVHRIDLLTDGCLAGACVATAGPNPPPPKVGTHISDCGRIRAGLRAFSAIHGRAAALAEFRRLRQLTVELVEAQSHNTERLSEILSARRRIEGEDLLHLLTVLTGTKVSR